MYNTVLNHKTGWFYAKQTYLICRTNTKNHPLVIKNERGSHAEKELMNRLDGTYILAILPVQVRHTTVQGG